MPGPFDNLIGELSPGQSGWLPLDEAGTPTGPATLLPPPALGSFAASVYASNKDPLGENDHALVSSSGAPLDLPLVSNVDKRVTPGPVPPTLVSLTPTEAAHGSADFVLSVAGTGFTFDSVINFNGADLTTTVESPELVTATVQPSLVSAAADVPVEVHNSAGTSNVLTFSFIDPVARSKKTSSRN